MSARDAAERDLAQAHANARHLEEGSRAESERLMLAAQERSDVLIAEAERRAHAINNVLGARLETLTGTHRDVVERLAQLHATVAEVLARDGEQGPFEVPSAPAEVAAQAPGARAEYVHPDDEHAHSGADAYLRSATDTPPSLQVPASASRWGSVDEGGDPDPDDTLDGEQVAAEAAAATPADRRLDLTSVPDKTHH